MSVRLHLGDCLSILPTIPDASVDAIIADPPYPCIDRDYGRMTEAEWHAMMRDVVAESRRILKPSGSAVFVLQPNSRKVGSMRGWLFEFQAWCCREWNMVQDAWWWNINAIPVSGAGDKGLMRPSLKACVWLGGPECYRDQESVLWDESQGAKAARLAGRFGRSSRPSGWRPGSKPRDTNHSTMRMAAERRGGVTPFNVIPVGKDRSGHGHGASTPFALCDYWARYICPPGGTICDPFMGSGTTGLSAIKYGCSYVGIEKFAKYYAVAERRIKAAEPEAPLLAACR